MINQQQSSAQRPDALKNKFLDFMKPCLPVKRGRSPGFSRPGEINETVGANRDSLNMGK